MDRSLVIRDNLRNTRDRIDSIASNSPTLVVVSKTFPISDIQYAYDMGQRHFGESYAQELILPNDIRWHYIGALQGNKLKSLAAIPNVIIETLDSQEKASKLNSLTKCPIDTYIQVNTSGEDKKHGVSPSSVETLAQFIVEQCPNLRLTGLMTIGSIRDGSIVGDNPDFTCLAECRRALSQALHMPIDTIELSMGMSADFEQAVQQVCGLELLFLVPEITKIKIRVLMAGNNDDRTSGLAGVKNVILVLSGKGGVGKSSVSVQLAITLVLADKKVGILDVDLCGPSVPRMLNTINGRITQGTGGWQPVIVEDSGHQIKVISIGFLLPNRDDAVIWRGPKKSSMISQFVNNVEWGELDYLIIDTPPGTSDEHISLVENLHQQNPRAIIVTTPQLVALADVARIIGFCQTVKLPIIGLIENMSGYLCPHCSRCTNIFSREGGKQLAEKYQIPFLAQVPISPAFVKSVEIDEARPISDYIEKTPELHRIFKDIMVILTSSREEGYYGLNEALKRIGEFLSLEEILQFPLPIGENESAVDFFRSIADGLAQFKEKHVEMEKQMTESRLRHVNLEQSLKNLQYRHGEGQSELNKLRTELAEAKSRIESLGTGPIPIFSLILISLDTAAHKGYGENAGLQEELDRVVHEFDTMKAKYDRLESEKVDLLRTLQRRQLEIDDLNDQVEANAGRMKELRDDAIKKERLMAELQGKFATSQLQLELTKEETGKYQQLAEWNGKELEQTLNDFSAYRRQKSTEIALIQGQMDSSQANAFQLEGQNQNLRSSSQEKDRRIEELLKKVRDLENKLREQESMFIQEISAKERLSNLYKESLDETSARLEAAESMLQANYSVDERIREVEQEFAGRLEEMKADLQGKDEEIGVLRRHLDEMGGGLSGEKASLSRVYSEYAHNKTALVKAEHEIERLKGCISNICQDLEARVPALQAERKENEKLKADICSLTEQLMKLNRAKDVADLKAKEAMEKIKQKEILEQQVNDLGIQVQHLLRSMEFGDGDDMDVLGEEKNDGGNILDADQVINERLVVFKNIQELQIRNQELLRVVRELSAQQETVEVEKLKAADAEMRTKLEEMSKELEELREIRHKQTVLVESLIRQRDMLREMHSANSHHSSSDDIRESRNIMATPINQNGVIMVEEYELFKREKNQNEKHLMEQLETTREQLLEAKNMSARLNAQLEFNTERYDLLKQNYDMERKELENLRRSNGEALSSIMQHQSQVQKLMTELLTAKETQQKLMSDLSKIRVELEMRQVSERRFSDELLLLREEKERLTTVLIGLQTINKENEASETELKERLGKQVEGLEKEVQGCRLRLAEEIESNKLAISKADREYRELVRRYDQLMETYNKTKEEAVQSRINTSEMTKKIADLESLLNRNEERLNQLMRPTLPGEASDLPRELAATKAKLASIEDELKIEKENVMNYKEIARAAEGNLIELTKTYDEYRNLTERKTADLENKFDYLNNLRDDLKQQVADAQEKIDQLKLQLQVTESNHRQELRELQHQLNELKEYESMTKSHSLLRKEDVDRLQELVEEVRQRYEQEVIAHGRDVETLTTLKNQISRYESQINELSSALATAQDSINAHEAILAREKENISSDRLDLEKKVAELESQNNILLGQIEQRNSSASRRASGIIGSSGAEPSNVNELVEVISYLRRQKDILQVEHDSMAIEYRRIKSQAEQLHKSLDENRALLEEERKANQWQAQIAAEYSTLAEKVGQLNIVRESNTTLRAEAESLTRNVVELESKLQKALDSLHPIEEEKRQLQARIAMLNEEIKIIKSDRDHWKGRFDQLLVQFNRVDDEGEKTQLKKEKTELENELKLKEHELEIRMREVEEHKTTLEEANNKVSQWESKYKALLLQSRQIAKAKEELSKRIAELEKEKDNVTVDTEALSSLAAERDRLLTETTQLKIDITEKTAKLEKYAEAFKKVAKMKEQFRETQGQYKTMSDALKASEQKVEEVTREAELRTNLLNSNWQGKIRKLNQELEELRKKVDPSDASHSFPTELGKREDSSVALPNENKRQKSNYTVEPVQNNPVPEVEIVEEETDESGNEGDEEQVETAVEDDKVDQEQPSQALMGMDDDELMLGISDIDEDDECTGTGESSGAVIEPEAGEEEQDEEGDGQFVDASVESAQMDIPKMEVPKRRVIDLSEIAKRAPVRQAPTPMSHQSAAQAHQHHHQQQGTRPGSQMGRGGTGQFRGRGQIGGLRRIRRGGGQP